jgi:hypothetical protein
VLLDGVGAAAVADDVAVRLSASGRRPLRVRAEDFLRPAGERFEHGREDPDALRTGWLDEAALRREVLEPVVGGRYLPALRDAVRDRSVRTGTRPAPERSVLLLDGSFLLGRGLPGELAVHLALSAGALRRRGLPDWQVGAHITYAERVFPRSLCDVLVLAEDPARPAVVVRRGAVR